MAGALTAAPDPLSAAFYNPAGISGQGTALSFGLADSVPNFHIDRTRHDSQIDSAIPEAAPRFELGASTGIGSRVRLGAAASFPSNRLLRLENLDSARPQFLLWQSKPQRFFVSVNTSIRITDKLHAGVGLMVGQSQSGAYRFGLDVPDRKVTVREERVDATFSPAAVIGLLAEPAPDVHIGFTWRAAQAQHTDVPTIFDLQSLGSLEIQTGATTLYWPHVLSLGGSIKRGQWLASAQVDVQLWSLAPSEEMEFAILPSGAVLTDTGLGDLLGFDAPARAPGFHTIAIPRAAAEWQYSQRVTLRAGAAFKPAITPDETGLSSYLDNPTVTLGAGAALALPENLTVEAAASAALLLERQMKKANPADPTGGAAFGGRVFTLSAAVRYAY